MGGSSSVKTLAIITVVLLVIVIAVLFLPRKVELEDEEGNVYTGKTGVFIKSANSGN